MAIATSWSAVALGTAALIGVLTSRSLGPAGRGELSLTLAVGAIVSLVGALGSNVAIRKHLRADNEVSIADYRAISLRLGGLTAALLALCYGALVTVGPLAHHWSLLIIFIVFGLGSFINTQCIDLVYALAKPIAAAKFAAYSTAATLLLATSVAFVNPSSSSFLMCYALGSLVGALFCLRFIKRFPISKERSKFGSKILVGDGLRLLGMNIGQALTAQMPTILLGLLSTTAQTGHFTAASTPAGLFRVPANVLAQLSMVDSASAHVKINYFWRRLLYLALGSAAVAIICVISAPWLITIIYGAEFLPAVAVFRILVVGEILFIPYIVMSKVLAVRGRAIFASFAGLTGLGTSLVSGYLLIAAYGAVGAAVAATTAYGIMSIFVVVCLRTKRS